MSHGSQRGEAAEANRGARAPCPRSAGLSCFACPGAVTPGDWAICPRISGPFQSHRKENTVSSQVPEFVTRQEAEHVRAPPRGPLGVLKRIPSSPTLSLLSFATGKKSCSALQGHEGAQTLYPQRGLILL